MREIDLQGAQQLWRRVVLQAVRDALVLTLPAKDPAVKRDRREARAWIERGGKDFQEVCTLAGFEPDVVRDWWLSIRDTPQKIEAAARRMRDANYGPSAFGEIAHD
ncbi:MAG: hypothetical protein RLZ51_1875 [Pseudomonadota bacterium]|jgi:hypothetical protein